MRPLFVAAAAPLPPADVRDTIAAVFSHPAYDLSLRRSLGDRMLDWLVRLISAGYDAIRGSANIRWVIIAIAAVIATIVLARALYLAGMQTGWGRHRSRAAAPRIDPWRAAADAAARGNHTEAAHLLHAAVLETLAVRHRVRLHPSRTPREYESDLRLRAPAAAPAYAAFVRAYEPVVWRDSSCDEATFRRLEQFARAVTAPVEQSAAA